MRLHLLLLSLASNALLSSALKVSFNQAKRSLSPRGAPFAVSRPTALPNPNVLAAASGNDGLNLKCVNLIVATSSQFSGTDELQAPSTT